MTQGRVFHPSTWYLVTALGPLHRFCAFDYLVEKVGGRVYSKQNRDGRQTLFKATKPSVQANEAHFIFRAEEET